MMVETMVKAEALIIQLIAAAEVITLMLCHIFARIFGLEQLKYLLKLKIFLGFSFKGGCSMKILNLIDKLKDIATEIGDFKDNHDTIIMIKNEDGTYTEVKSDDNN
jgi:hypothetical protein